MVTMAESRMGRVVSLGPIADVVGPAHPVASGVGMASSRLTRNYGRTLMPIASSSTRAFAVAMLVALVAASPVRAQEYSTYGRFELTPFGGYNWGGSFSTDAGSNFPSGELSAASTGSWGVIISRLQYAGTAAEIFYLRQDASVTFDGKGEAPRDVGTLANNYIQIGGRRALRAEGVSPFISASLGTNILDSDNNGAVWRFAFTLGGGVKVPLGNPRYALRVDARWLATLVPSGDLESWCSVWGCYTASGSTLLNQGSATAGLSIGF